MRSWPLPPLPHTSHQPGRRARKECEGALDSPGDGLPLTGTHPDYVLTDLQPTGSNRRSPRRPGCPTADSP